MKINQPYNIYLKRKMSFLCVFVGTRPKNLNFIP